MGTLHESSGAPPVNPGASFAFPLTSAQLRLWFLDQLTPNETSYLVAWAVRIRGPLDAAALQFSLNEIFQRHEIFRTRYVATGGEPVQLLTPGTGLALPVVDLTHLDAVSAEAEARRLARVESLTPIELAEGPMLRVQLLRIAAEEHVLLLTTHHICFDGWSRGIFLSELAFFYETRVTGRNAELPELPIQYGDYAVWQQERFTGEYLAGELGYWKQQLKDLPLSVTLPTDRPRPAVQTFNGSFRPFTLPRMLLDQIRQVSKREGVTPYMTMLAVFQLLVARYSGTEDIVLGTPTANRNRPELEGMIGLFANTLVLRTQLGGDPTFRELLARVKETALSAYAHEEMPFEQLVHELSPERSLSHSPLFQILFSLRNTPGGNFHLAGNEVEWLHGAGETSKYDLSMYLEEHRDGLRGKIEYNTDLYDATTIERILKHYEVLLGSAVAGPEKRLAELDMLGAADRRQLLVDWNDTAQEYPRTRTVHQLIAEQVERTPDAPAIVFGTETISYREMNRRANQVANTLRAKGVRRGARVAVYLERSPALLIALLGVIKSGAAYVPLDPSYPTERLRIVIEDADIGCLITEQALVPGKPAYDGEVVCLDSEAVTAAPDSDAGLMDTAEPEDAMYVMFTSGSTGRPKGVEVPHRAAVNYLTWMARELQVGPADVVTAITSFAFDISVDELFMAPMVGASVLMVERGVSLDGEALSKYLTRFGATVLQATPTTWQLLLDAGFSAAGMKRCIGGEALPRELYRRLMMAAPGTPLYNVYGPTETTIWSTFHKFTCADETVVIGRPLANTQVYLLDRNLQPVPVGVLGDLYISGDGVTHGYFGRPELTAEKFLPNPFGGPWKLYSTGDVARYLADGRIEYIGRTDSQVKIRGFRIELAEIEGTLAKHPEVRECVVIAREDEPGNKYIAAYVVAQNPQAPSEPQRLREYLKHILPDYMVPTAWLTMEKFPLTANGKVDRKSLPVPDQMSAKVSSEELPVTAVEIRLATIWEETLNLSPIRRNDDFFSVGGHSMLAAQMMAKAREAFGCELSLTLLFSFPRLVDLAKVIETERGKQPFKALIPIRKTGTKPPLFCIARPNVNALGFIFLSRHLSPDQPIYGLQSRTEKDGDIWVYDQSDYEERAREYIKVLREDFPDGPYLLTGYCEGAHIAFEMARELDRMGLPVGMVAILDAWPVENTVSRTKYILRNYWREFRSFRRKNFVDKLHVLTGSIFKRHEAVAASIDPAEAELARQRQLIAEQVAKRYWPGPEFVPTRYRGLLTLFRTKKQLKVRINDYKMGWGQRALGGVEVYPIDGSHFALLREPSVIYLAKQMQECIDRSLAEKSQVAKKPAVVAEVLHATVDAS